MYSTYDCQGCKKNVITFDNQLSELCLCPGCFEIRLKVELGANRTGLCANCSKALPAVSPVLVVHQIAEPATLTAAFCDSDCVNGWRNGEKQELYLATVRHLKSLLQGSSSVELVPVASYRTSAIVRAEASPPARGWTASIAAFFGSVFRRLRA